jgi:uncharacterized tellurite resistance protein B-like protein
MEEQTLLEGYNDEEKTAYLSAIASIATADEKATDEEVKYLDALCTAANLPEEQKEVVTRSAANTSGAELPEHLEKLKNSELRFSLVTDLIAFAKTDENYSEKERQQIWNIAKHVGVNQQQYAVLDEVTEKAATVEAEPEQKMQPNFLGSLGLKDKVQSAGINANSLFKGLIGIAGPMILSRMLGGMFGGGNRRTGGMMGGGGLGGALGGGGLMGGLGSLIGMLNGGRGYQRSGGMLGRVLGF